MEFKTQTLFIDEDFEIIKQIDDFLYDPIKDDTVILNDNIWAVNEKIDIFDCDDRLIRKIYIKPFN